MGFGALTQCSNLGFCRLLRRSAQEDTQMPARLGLSCGLVNAAAFLFATLLSSQAVAYEIATHALTTHEAYQRSVLNPSHPETITKVIGFNRLDKTRPFGESYFDNPGNVTTTTEYRRGLSPVERRILEQLIEAERISYATVDELVLTEAGWLMQGVVREDDNELALFGVWTAADDFDLDPWGHLFRAPGHFYDPVHGRAFVYRNTCNFYECVRSPIWALGRVNPFSPTTDVENLSRRNHFTLADATRSYWMALTGRRDFDGAGYGSGADRLQSSEERRDRWATAIKSLGHVVHLIQDGAQAQHTRNDAHSPPRVSLGPNNDSNGAYEAYTEARVTRNPALSDGSSGNPFREMDEGVPDIRQLPAPVLGGYPPVSFATPIRYFTTRHIDMAGDPSTINSRRGVTDFSNRNFFTNGSLPGHIECNPPGTDCIPTGNPTYALPENDLENPAVYSEFLVPDAITVGGKPVTLLEYARKAVDSVSPGYQDSLAPIYQGKVPVVTRGVFAGDPDAPATVRALMRYNIFAANADVLLPRAVAYSAGLVNHFFRGRLEVLAPNDRVVAVLNQGAAHTMTPDGYPCAGLVATDGCAQFGFEKVRVRVRNATTAIVESGTGQSIPQRTGGAGTSSLVAVARYHRNSCYKPNLAGERVQSYAPPPALSISEPACAAGEVTRTNYQEISVSAVLGVADGELDAPTAGNGVEKVFDFSQEPIPVNATDLFIQVVYRGPMGDAALGREDDVVAVGILDVREPTFASFWNNTDYYWNSTNWLAHTPTYPNEGVKDFWVCSGGVLPKLVFHYQGGQNTPAMIDPFIGSGTAGQVRLGFVFPPPDAGMPAQRKTIRGVPVNYSTPGYPQIPLRSAFTSGQFRQANLEQISSTALASPFATCATQLPTSVEYWCFDPIQQRRGQRFGTPAQPLYLEPTAGGVTPTDVDAVPLPALSGTAVLANGTVRFNTDQVLINCPAQPAGGGKENRTHVRLVELSEEAESLGIVE